MKLIPGVPRDVEHLFSRGVKQNQIGRLALKGGPFTNSELFKIVHLETRGPEQGGMTGYVKPGKAF
jgi:hypothetical protein